MATMGMATAPSPVNQPAQDAQRLAAEQKLVGAAKWFYWIAGLSVINAGFILSGAGWRFLLGLGIIDQVAETGGQTGNAGMVAAIFITAFITGICALFGSLALKKHAWVFWVGMALYALDGFLVFTAGNILAVAFHAFVLFCLFQGPVALKQLKAMGAA
jgi:hypothetical protein